MGKKLPTARDKKSTGIVSKRLPEFAKVIYGMSTTLSVDQKSSQKTALIKSTTALFRATFQSNTPLISTLDRIILKLPTDNNTNKKFGDFPSQSPVKMTLKK